MNTGESFNGVTVIEVTNSDKPRSKRRYLIHRDCCGVEMWIGHNRLLVIKKMDHDSICRACDEKSGLRSKRRNSYLERQKEDEGRIYVPHWGYTLGKMGMR